MFRGFLYLVLAIFAIALLRAVIGIVMKAAGELMAPASESPPRRAGAPPTSGELKRDPVCGTYVSAATSVKKTVKGEVVHFCSPACRDKFLG